MSGKSGDMNCKQPVKLVERNMKIVEVICENWSEVFFHENIKEFVAEFVGLQLYKNVSHDVIHSLAVLNILIVESVFTEQLLESVLRNARGVDMQGSLDVKSDDVVYFRSFKAVINFQLFEVYVELRQLEGLDYEVYPLLLSQLSKV